MSTYLKNDTAEQSLVNLLNEAFSREELFDLMFNAGLDGEEIASNRNGKTEITRELARYLARRGVMSEFLPYIDKARPNLVVATNDIRKKLGEEAVEVPPEEEAPPEEPTGLPQVTAELLLVDAMLKLAEVQSTLLQAKRLLG